jgi:hypothetical protein
MTASGVQGGDCDLPLGAERGFAGEQSGQRRFGRAIVLLGAGKREYQFGLPRLGSNQAASDQVQFGREGGDGILRVGGKRGFACPFFAKLTGKPIELDQTAPSGVERGAGGGEAMGELLPFLAGAGGGPPALGDQGGGIGLRSLCFLQRAGQGRHFGHCGVGVATSIDRCSVGPGPAAVKEAALGKADAVGECAVALRRPSLALQCGDAL